MLQVDVTAQVRTDFGKGAARTMRRAGQTPAILYGAKSDPIALALDTRSFTKTLLKLQRRNAVVTLDVEGGATHHVLIKEVQVDPILDSLKHADFCKISLESPGVFKVPINYTGKAVGVDLGGEMVVSMRTLSLKANPLDIPDSIDVEVAELNIGDSVSCKDMPLPDNVTLLDDENRVCIAVQVATGSPDTEDEEDSSAAEESPAEDAAE
jgi:large subunit ribosomal protein L25